jgi:hypothetical protein
MKLKPLQLIHTSFFAAVLLFALIVLFLNKESLFFSTQMANTNALHILFPLVGLISITIGIFLFNKMLSNIPMNGNFETKFKKYQEACIIKFALLEFGAILNIIGCMLTGNLIFMLFAGISLLALLASRPVKAKTISDLQLQYPDTEALD